IVPLSFGCGAAVFAAIATLAPSRAARNAIASPMPRLPPDTNSVLPLSDVIKRTPVDFNRRWSRVLHLSHRVRGYSLTIDRHLSPQPSPHGRGSAPSLSQ